jgi:uncharacterized protein (UPF0212 family)
LAPRSLPRKHHVYVDANVGKDLCAKCAGTKSCNLGANNNGAKLMVYFLKSYWQGEDNHYNKVVVFKAGFI